LLALWLCVSFVQFGSAVQVNSADFQVNVNVETLGYPQWSFYQNDNTSYVYTVTFVGLWETENSTDYDLVANSPLPGNFGWNVTKGSLANSSQAVSVMTAKGQGLGRYDTLAFNTHIPMNAVNGTDYPAGKFDVQISNYKWVSASETAQLVLAFSLELLDKDAPQRPNLTTHGSRTIDFGGAYFSINSTAMGGPNTPNTSLSAMVKLQSDMNSSHIPLFLFTNSHSVYLIYDHFETNMMHDPEFGFGAGPGNSYIWIIIIVVVVIAIIVIILIAVIGFILVRRRRRSYDAF